MLVVAAAAGLLQSGSAAQAPARALVAVRTLVIDGMGTRTVDTDTARVPFGSKGVLIKRVPYAGPPLSFRLSVLAGSPQDTGIPITLSADVWSGDTSTLPRPEEISHREEATVIAPESSYLFEIDHDAKTDRRIVLSVSARPISEDELVPIRPVAEGSPIQFLMEVTRQSGGEAEAPDVHLLNTMVGQAVTYSSGIKMPDPRGGSSKIIGLTVIMTAEQVQGSLVTVKVELSGFEFVDALHSKIEPISHTEVQTVTAGERFETRVTVPSPDPAADAAHTAPDPGVRPVTYTVGVTPMLG
jgi:hypothetical protein